MSKVAASIVSKNADVFAELLVGLPPDRGVHHTINTANGPPVSKPAYHSLPEVRCRIAAPGPRAAGPEADTAQRKCLFESCDL